MTYIERTIKRHLINLATHFPAVAVTGARQTGKTTLMKEAFGSVQGIKYVTLDYPMLRNLAQNDPEMFLQQYPAPVIIDEIQYAPELLPYIKIRIDEDRKPGQYFLTGSQMFHLMKNLSESLAGRVGLVSLYGLSNREITGRKANVFLPTNQFETLPAETVVSIFDKIYRGGMPQMVVDPMLQPEDYFSAYVQTYIERDIRDLIEIKKERSFLSFLSCSAARTGQELNINSIASDVGIDGKTAERWLSLLVTSGLVFLLQPYSGNTIKRIVKRPKLYFMDTGLACYLSLWNNPRALENSAMAGAMFETYVLSELIKQYSSIGMDVRSRFSYYRDNNSSEIDLIIAENGIIYPIEIKKSTSPDKNSLKNFKVLSSLNAEIGHGAVICLSPFAYPIDNMNKAVPIGAI